MKKSLIQCFIVTVMLISCSSGKTIDEEQFNKVEIGMKENEVKFILGEPDDIRRNLDSTIVYYYFTANNAMTKKYARVSFDRSGYVRFLLYKNPS
ncbi:MAG TPA: outer membrane protein assembly factor BamE [Chitinophagaceae bacterium]|nr:outer membrane protein assembly factor BamE [Chitinophagaceae bacterium]